MSQAKPVKLMSLVNLVLGLLLLFLAVAGIIVLHAQIDYIIATVLSVGLLGISINSARAANVPSSVGRLMPSCLVASAVSLIASIFVMWRNSVFVAICICCLITLLLLLLTFLVWQTKRKLDRI